MLLVRVQQFGTGIKNDLEVLHQCSKRVKTKSQKVLGLIPTSIVEKGEKLIKGALVVFIATSLKYCKWKKV